MPALAVVAEIINQEEMTAKSLLTSWEDAGILLFTTLGANKGRQGNRRQLWKATQHIPT